MSRREATEFERLVVAVNRALRDFRKELGAGPCRAVAAAELSAFVAERFAAFSFDNDRGGEFEVDSPRLLAWHLASGRFVGGIPAGSGPERIAALNDHTARFRPLFERLKLERRQRVQARAAEFDRLRRGAA